MRQVRVPRAAQRFHAGRNMQAGPARTSHPFPPVLGPPQMRRLCSGCVGREASGATWLPITKGAGPRPSAAGAACAPPQAPGRNRRTRDTLRGRPAVPHGSGELVRRQAECKLRAPDPTRGRAQRTGHTLQHLHLSKQAESSTHLPGPPAGSKPGSAPPARSCPAAGPLQHRGRRGRAGATGSDCSHHTCACSTRLQEARSATLKECTCLHDATHHQTWPAGSGAGWRPSGR